MRPTKVPSETTTSMALAPFGRGCGGPPPPLGKSVISVTPRAVKPHHEARIFSTWPCATPTV